MARDSLANSRPTEKHSGDIKNFFVAYQVSAFLSIISESILCKCETLQMLSKYTY